MVSEGNHDPIHYPQAINTWSKGGKAVRQLRGKIGWITEHMRERERERERECFGRELERGKLVWVEPFIEPI